LRGRLVRVRVRVRAGKSAVRGAVVRVGQRRGVTDRRGVARVRVRFMRAGKRKAVARARGYKLGRATLRVRK
jgi:hypothetical protein